MDKKCTVKWQLITACVEVYRPEFENGGMTQRWKMRWKVHLDSVRHSLFQLRYILLQIVETTVGPVGCSKVRKPAACI